MIKPTGVPEPAAVAELLGMLALGELLAFERMAADARLAPDLHRRATLCQMAAQEMVNYQRLVARLAELGVDPEQAMAPYEPPLRGYHDRTQPRDWPEALTKAYLGDSVADDFVREVAALLAPADRKLVLQVLHDSQYAEFAAAEIRAAIDADARVAHRLSMWGRRLMGEGLWQAQQVAGARPHLAALITSGTGDSDGVAALLKRLAAGHTERMVAVGLNP
ncbi:MAG TPA: ferritin-like fold-containing protein [Natronosporangium sp.]|nr:ferritin-like fold-containing protein [Natronosporangium sp.]